MDVSVAVLLTTLVVGGVGVGSCSPPRPGREVRVRAGRPTLVVPGSLLLEIGGELGQRGGESGSVVLGGDAGGDVVGADVHPRPGVTAVTSQVIVMVPAKAGSSETKSTACTTRTPGTTSTKRASTMSESAVALPACSRGVRVRQDEPVRPARPGVERSNLPLIPSGGSQAVSASGSTRAGKRGPAARRSPARPCRSVPWFHRNCRHRRPSPVGTGAPVPAAPPVSALRSITTPMPGTGP